MEILDRDRVLIISGAPGVGKATLANMLLFAHLERGWQPVIIRRDISEGQKLFQRGCSQIFYFDDFMGATFLGDRASGLLRNEDRAISDFIDQVRCSRNARLILTTREHIFGQALAVSERLRQAGLGVHKIVLRIGDYSFAQKAQMLYNHTHFSDLPESYKDAMLASDFYLEVLRHTKFNPRLIEWLSSFNRLRSVQPEKYQYFIRNLLRDPSEVWLHAYEQQLSDAGRSLLLAIYSLGGKSEGVVLRAAFKKLHDTRAGRWGLLRRPEDWATAMAELVNAFIRPTGESAFEVIDPSVIDLVNAVIRKAPENAVDIVLGAIDFNQFERVWDFGNFTVTPVRTAIVQGGRQIAAAIRSLTLKTHRFVASENSHISMQWTEEARVAAIIPIADEMKIREMLEFSNSLGEAMESAWAVRGVHINDGVRALQSLERVAWPPLKATELKRCLIENLVAEAQVNCRSDELGEIVDALDLEGPENALTLDGLKSAFEGSRHAIAAEIRDCRTEEDFDSLQNNYNLFASVLGVNVRVELARLDEAYSEYSDYEEQRAESMMDEYGVNRGESRVSEETVRDVFASLRGDQ